MKKLMFAAAVMAAGAAMAVESQVVGYQGNQMNAADKTMACGTFMNVSTSGKVVLSDLSVTGYTPSWYDDEEEGCWVGGCKGGNFVVNVLSATGSATASYYWLDFKDGDDQAHPTVYGPGWFKLNTSTSEYEPLTAAELAAAVFDSGTAFWIYGTNKKLVSSGQVEAKDLAIQMRASDKTAAGNATPITQGLGDLTVTGYKASWYDDEEEGCWVGGCKGGNFVLNVLSPTGLATASYYWLDFKDGDDQDNPTIYGPGWFTLNTSTSEYEPIPAAELSTIQFTAGKGFWIYGTGKKLVVPAPEM